nr:Lrp/AsnC family transcriptional regulator [Candidatus Baldrarchaeota archaeon]
MKGDEQKVQLDDIDVEILKILQKDCRVTLDQMSKMLNVPKSTLHYRIKRLEKQGVIEGYYAKINPAKLGKEYITVTLVRAKYGPGYHKKVGEKLAKLPGVWAVYFVLGETDFIILTRSNSRETFMKTLEQMINSKEIERTSTMVVTEIIKEDPRIEL